MTTKSKPKPSGSVPAALNVYKKVAIIRGSDDVLTYEDTDGNFKTVADLHLAAVATVSGWVTIDLIKKKNIYLYE
jgi:hypothetical protein